MGSVDGGTTAMFGLGKLGDFLRRLTLELENPIRIEQGNAYAIPLRRASQLWGWGRICGGDGQRGA